MGAGVQQHPESHRLDTPSLEITDSQSLEQGIVSAPLVDQPHGILESQKFILAKISVQANTNLAQHHSEDANKYNRASTTF